MCVCGRGGGAGGGEGWKKRFKMSSTEVFTLHANN